MRQFLKPRNPCLRERLSRNGQQSRRVEPYQRRTQGEPSGLQALELSGNARLKNPLESGFSREKDGLNQNRLRGNELCALAGRSAFI